MKRFLILTIIAVAALIAAAFLYLERVTAPEKPETGRETTLEKSGGEKPPRKEEKAFPPLQADRKKLRQVAILIDDIGFDMKALKELAEIPAPIAFAVIPFTPHCAEATTFLYGEKREILLHLPMEPLFYPKVSPGRGALLVEMDEGVIIRQLEDDLAAVPHASGVNNHMGSRFMEDASHLNIVMGELRKRNLFFIDSRTTPHTMGKQAASLAGVRFAERDMFIDHEHGYEAAFKNLRDVSKNRKIDGKTMLLIGHPHADTIRALRDVMPLWEKEGIEVVDIRTCLRK